ncbi:MAG: hypoxanthine phosphoribosyltransferase [Planctomycetes bacterium]|nr:hypoxanthine phosphoribosyltransferase [Planctomycetota bacterium]
MSSLARATQSLEREGKTCEILISEERVLARVAELGREITRDYQGRDLDIVGVLKGCALFMSDLIRSIDLPLACDYLRVSSYDGGTESRGVVRFDLDVSQPVTGKHVLLVEDIIDTGLTMSYLLENLRTRHPASLAVCALLHKPARTIKPVPIDYLGFTIENHFVVGYGLDYAGRYRNLRHIAKLEDIA